MTLHQKIGFAVLKGARCRRGLTCAALLATLLFAGVLGSTGCYRRVVGVKGAGAGQYEVYEPSVREESLSERRAEERARAKAEAEKGRAEAEKQRAEEAEKK